MQLKKMFLGIDLNIDAIHNAIGNAELNNMNKEMMMECVQMSLFQGLRPNLVGNFLILNHQFYII